MRFLPILTWLRGYKRADLPGDLTAGITVAVMLVPQAMAYAMLAGLPPIVGVYAATVPLLLYALFGTSRQLAVGPVAMISLLVATAIAEVAPGADASTIIAVALLLALMTGVIQLLLGLMRLGFLVNFLSHPVISGFTSAAAIIIGLSQLKHLLGVKAIHGEGFLGVMTGAIEHGSETHVVTLAIGASAIAILLVLRRIKKTIPGALVVVVLGAAIVYFARLHEHGVAIVGEVPAGLPPLSGVDLDFDRIRALLPMAIAIALVGFMESVAVAKSFASRNRYTIDANQELIGLGVANIGAAFFSGYPVTGGFSRTAVNAQAGARTPLASMITALLIVVALLVLTPLFYYLPKAVLAAIVIAAVLTLIDVKEVVHLWRVHRRDLAVLIATFATTLALGIEPGILIGVLASVALFMLKTTRPHVAVLGRLPGTSIFRNVERFPDAQPIDGVLIVRVDAAFYYGNIAFLKERLTQLEAAASKAGKLRAVVLDASGINHVDSSAATGLHEIARDCEQRGVHLYLANAIGPVRDMLARCELDREFAGGGSFPTVQDALDHLDGATAATPPASTATS